MFLSIFSASARSFQLPLIYALCLLALLAGSGGYLHLQRGAFAQHASVSAQLHIQEYARGVAVAELLPDSDAGVLRGLQWRPAGKMNPGAYAPRSCPGWFAPAVPVSVALTGGRLHATYCDPAWPAVERAVLAVLLVGCLALLLTLLAGPWLFFQYYLRHLFLRLEESLRRISRGEYSHRLESAAHPELQRVIQSVNEMAAEIESREQALRDGERKYKHLVEDSHDIIFSLDEQGIVLTMNRALRRHLGRAPAQIVGRPFAELLYDSPRSFRQGLEELRRTRGRVEFRAHLMTAQNEPREMSVQLEDVHAEGGASFVHGKARALTADILAQYCDSEIRRYTMGNYLSIGEMLIHTMTANLHRYLDRASAGEVRVGAIEMLYNAIEHGNLNIDYDEKTRTTASPAGEEYFQLIRERQLDERYRDRRVSISYSLNARRAIFIIRDQGAGFDHQAMVKDRVSDGALLYHGRGIAMAREIFDRVHYNARGNAVMLIKSFDVLAPENETAQLAGTSARTRTGMPSSTALPDGRS